MFKADLFADYINNPAAKEISRYSAALKHGISFVARDQLLTMNRILDIHQAFMQNDAGIRKLPGFRGRNTSLQLSIVSPELHTRNCRRRDLWRNTKSGGTATT